MNSRKPIWVAIILALVALPQIALGRWNDDWKFRKRLTIDVTARRTLRRPRDELLVEGPFGGSPRRGRRTGRRQAICRSPSTC